MSLFRLETTPLHNDALGHRGTPLEAFVGVGWHLFHEMGQPTFALVVGYPLRKDKPLGWVGMVCKTGKKICGFLTF